jgi:PKHD-type hydroxylase
MAHLPIWYLGQVPSSVCDAALAEFMAIEPRDAAMGVAGDTHNHSQRSTTIRFAQDDHWFGHALFGHGIAGNRACAWGFEVDRREAVQFAEYGDGQHYDWHVDTFPLAGLDSDRKVTVVCLMNDPSEFVGGEFEIRLYAPYTAPLSKGSVIAFPSMLEHRVAPVTSGKRYSATMWLGGPRFR